MDNNANQDGSGEQAKIKLGEVEYTTEELEGLVKDGQFKREIEEKQNTKIDRVLPEYTKLTQDRKAWETERQELEQLRAEKTVAQSKGSDTLDEATIAAARAEARKIGIFTKDDIEAYVNENFPKFYQNQRAGEKLLEGAEKLEAELDGKDGRPKFEIEDILTHMRDTGIRDPYKAYKDKYETELDSWKEKQLRANRREGLLSDSASSAGGKQPAEIRPNKTNLKDLFAEALRESSSNR